MQLIIRPTDQRETKKKEREPKKVKKVEAEELSDQDDQESVSTAPVKVNSLVLINKIKLI